MGNSRTLRFVALVLAGGAASAAIPAATASGKPLLHERFHNEGTVLVEDFCSVDGLDVEIAFVADGKVLANTHGRDGYAYFLEHFRETGVFTNLANLKTVTTVDTVVNHDLRVTDNGDGTLTIFATGTGNSVVYGPSGKALARNPGQIRVEIRVDHGGTPTNPFDDEFLGSEVVRPSTGRSDDFCAAAVPALT